MAFVTDGFDLSICVVDTQLQDYRMNFKLRATDYATAVTQTATILAALGTVSGTVVKSYKIGATAVEDALVAPTGVDAQVVAEVSYAIVGKVRGGTFSIPGPLEAVFVGPSGAPNAQVDLTNTDVIAYAQLFQDTGVAYISDGDDLAFMKSGRRTVGKRRKKR